MNKRGLESLPTFAEEGKEPGVRAVNVVVETPKGSRNKYKHEPERGLFLLNKVLPAGAVFPFDFGYLPGTRGQDGDPLDVLLLMDEPAFAGCVVVSRLIGVIEAEQSEKEGEPPVRNDRLIAVAQVSQTHKNINALSDLDDELVAEIEHFFVSYDEIAKKVFRPLARKGPDAALRLVKERQVR